MRRLRQLPRRRAHRCPRGADQGGVGPGDEPGVAPRPLLLTERGEGIQQLLLLDVGPQLAGRHVLQVVRLVHDQVVVLGEDLALQGLVGEQQGVVDHDQVRPLRPAPGAGEKAPPRPVIAAQLGRAVQRVRGQAGRPAEGLPVVQGQLAAVPRLRLGQPEEDLRRQEPVGVALHPLPDEAAPAAQAEVVGPALEHRRLERRREGLAQDGDVLVVELLLEVDGVGGDDHPAPVGHGVGRRRKQVGQALPDPGPGLDHQVQAVAEGLGHGAGHTHLAGAGLRSRAGSGPGARSRRRRRRPPPAPPPWAPGRAAGPGPAATRSGASSSPSSAQARRRGVGAEDLPHPGPEDLVHHLRLGEAGAGEEAGQALQEGEVEGRQALPAGAEDLLLLPGLRLRRARPGGQAG